MSAIVLHRHLDFILLQGSETPTLTAHTISENYTHIALGKDAKLLIAKNNPWSQQTSHAGQEYTFIGDVFFFDAKSPENSDGHYIAITKYDDKIIIFRNRNSQTGVYYFSNDKNQIVFSSLFPFYKKFHEKLNINFNEDSLSDFLRYGFITFGQTPFKNISRLPPRHRLQLNKNSFLLCQEAETSIPESILTNIGELFEFIQERFHLWLSQSSFKSIAISGGIDSRFIVASLLYKPPTNTLIHFHSRKHPLLSETEDLDVALGKQIAQLTPHPHTIQCSQDAPFAFLSQEPPAIPPVLSGLYGGEYLGGELLNLVSLRSFDENKTQPDSYFENEVMSQKNSSPFEENVRLKLDILSHASLCNTYEGAWIHIGEHHNLTLSPFTDTFLMELLGRLRATDLKNYSLYRKLYSLFPEQLRIIPLNSQMNSYYEDYPYPQFGKNPKLVAFNPPPTMTHISTQAYDLLPSKLKHLAQNNSNMRAFQKFLDALEIQ